MASQSVIQPQRRLNMPLNSAVRLPPFAMMARDSSRHSGLAGTMPRSRQISAMTAPIGRRRTTGSSPVAYLGGDLLGCGQASENGIGVDGRTDGRSGSARLARRRCVGWRGSLLVLTGAPEEE